MAVALALACALLYGVSDFLGGLASRKSAPETVLAATQPIGFVLLLAMLPFVPGRYYAADMWWGLISGAGFVVAMIAFYAALARGRMALVSPLAAVMGASVPVLFGYVAGDRPPVLAGVGIVLALIAVVLVSRGSDEESADSDRKALVPALCSGLGFGVALLFFSRGHHDAGLWVLFAARLASMIGVLAWAAMRRVPLVPRASEFKLLIAVAVLEMFANLCYVLATRVGMLPIVATTASLYPVSTVILACVVLREGIVRVQWIGIACALAGVALIAL